MPRKVRALQQGYFKDWVSGTELGRDGFKKLMQVELRRHVGCVGMHEGRVMVEK